jgi:hypothetical protein
LVQAVDAPAGLIEGQTTHAIDADAVVSFRDDAGEIPDGTD